MGFKKKPQTNLSTATSSRPEAEPPDPHKLEVPIRIQHLWKM
jgi:hypothetical protein